MWVPGDAVEIEEAARLGQLEETSSFDAKADLPAPKKNADLAVDVAAMSTDGGVLLYGVAEDDNGVPTIPNPIGLAGATERIDQIVATSIAEVPHTEVRTYPLVDDPTRGYLVVIVPQSARAPHQVIVGGNLRFYGRGPKGNRPLNEGDVARLYQRRLQWEQDRDSLLADAVQQAPFEPQDELAYMHGFARPVVPDRTIWDHAVEAAGGQAELQKLLAQTAAATKPREGYSPTLKTGANWRRHGADEWRLTSNIGRSYDDPTSASSTVEVRVNTDGRVHLFSGRAGAGRRKGNDAFDVLVLFEATIAGHLASFLAVVGKLYELGRYSGEVDVGFAATGLRDGFGSQSHNRFGFHEAHMAYGADSYERHDRVSATALREPEQVARPMLLPLMEALSGRDLDPYAE